MRGLCATPVIATMPAASLISPGEVGVPLSLTQLEQLLAGPVPHGLRLDFLARAPGYLSSQTRTFILPPRFSYPQFLQRTILRVIAWIASLLLSNIAPSSIPSISSEPHWGHV